MSTLLLWILVFCGLGAGLVAWGVWLGKQKARLEDKLEAAKYCRDGGYTNPSMIICPCQCGGVLKSDGRNKYDTLTFLVCNRCQCCYVAGDAKKEERRVS